MNAFRLDKIPEILVLASTIPATVQFPESLVPGDTTLWTIDFPDDNETSRISGYELWNPGPTHARLEKSSKDGIHLIIKGPTRIPLIMIEPRAPRGRHVALDPRVLQGTHHT
ncbi:hypothetical protein CC1G_15469 [Coprinopsis cinerea okayama7|uniref:Uncharacterized protein n=1 Tax=Coprinopsis cinerea (strain Okayama-7 / 130 / ATCC MYA-4618 / FGSC 9003) TaxID=240176 RepID=D6RQV3_COPC7|nr:hypothetical protein CC1G_15469 [Coprinopsis cinerea okayama7\|eukprot:XP_002910192.1 hypothetical protein CC1G_15469 [Coprinopsis cinerea okayama7\